MAVDPVPAVIHGAKHSADVFRQWIYDSTSGAEGISSPTGLRVRATGTPSGQVRVAPGGLIVRNSYQGGGGQSYSGRNASETLVSVPASDSTGAKSWNIIFRIQDPQFGGPAPANKESGPYSFIECVAKSANISDPHYVLAEVNVPKSTATITNAMVTDRREVANPLTLEVRRPRPNVAADNEYVTGTGPDGEWFPNMGGEQTIHIPEWATRVQIDATWMGIRYQSGSNAYGEYWVEFGPYLRPSTRKYSTQRFMYDTASSSNTYRTNWIAEDDRYVPAEVRGTDQIFVMKARKVGPDTGASIDGMSGVSLKVKFLQVADPSTS